MKWFSVLALGLLSVCGMSFAQDTSTYVVKSAPPRLRTVNYPEVKVNFPMAENNNKVIIPLGTPVPPTKLFTVSEDGVTFSVEQSGFFLPTLRITPMLSGLATGPTIWFQKMGAGSWTSLSNTLPLSVNMLNRLEFNPVELVAGSQYRLVVGVAGGEDFSFYFLGGQEGLRLDLRYLNNYTP